MPRKKEACARWSVRAVSGLAQRRLPAASIEKRHCDRNAALVQRLALGLEQRSDEEGMAVELHRANIAGFVGRGFAQRPADERGPELGIHTVAAKILGR